MVFWRVGPWKKLHFIVVVVNIPEKMIKFDLIQNFRDKVKDHRDYKIELSTYSLEKVQWTKMYLMEKLIPSFSWRWIFPQEGAFFQNGHDFKFMQSKT